MEPTLMIVRPERTSDYLPPPWSLLDERGSAKNVPVIDGDVVLCIGVREPGVLVEIVHSGSGMRGFIERGLLQPL
jgi:hypothetical protein